MGRYDFHEDRATYVREQLLETIDDGTEAGKDISSADLSVRLRIYTIVGTLIVDTALSKVSSGTTGIVAGNVTPAAAAGHVTCRLVLVDAGTANANTPTGDTEYVWTEWVDDIAASPQP